LDLSRIFRDGRPWKVFHPPLKDPPKLFPVSPYSKVKVRVWGTPNHLKWDFGAKNGKKMIPYPKV